jgi:pyridoxal phosphate enzyme (YggS family)
VANLAAARARIDAVAGGRTVELLAVTKGFGPGAVEAAATAGCVAIGENYAQELVGKTAAVAATGVAVHFIGQLQSNKVRLIAGLVGVWETIDRPSIVREVARRAPGAVVLVQVDATGEPGKGGCAPADVPGLVEAAGEAGLVVDGLMAVGPTTGGPESARPVFRAVRALADRLDLATCSMGMSGDLEVAVQEGATRVRLGTALFGPRR